MKIGYTYPEFQCPYCGIDIEDKGYKLINRVLFINEKPMTKLTCGNCGKKMELWLNDMEGKLVAYKPEERWKKKA